MNRPIVLITDGDPACAPLSGPVMDVRTLRDEVFELDLMTVTATVSDDKSAAAVLRAIQRGATAALQICLAEPFRSEFFDQLRRVADIRTHRAPALSDENRALLDHLRGGASLTQTAKALHVSRRTLDRRLAEIKSALDVSTTAEALRFRERTQRRP